VSKGPKSSGQRQGSLALLESLYLKDGSGAAREKFAEFLPEGSERPYLLIRPDDGKPAHRTDVHADDGITYESYSPPPFWEAPYALLKAHFDYVPKKDFMYHGGEEILVPIAGEVFYHFYSNHGTRRPREHALKPLKPGSAIVLNPQIPHHTWGGREGADAWMISRHVSDSASAISFISTSNVDLPLTPRTITKKALQQPGAYALVAWGIAEKIRLHRDRAKLRIGKLANACDLDPSHLSRIENASTNVSIETLVKIARILRIGLDELIAPKESQWFFEVAQLPKSSNTNRVVKEKLFQRTDPGSQLLTTIHWEIPAGGPSEQISPNQSLDEENPLSWIVLKGRVIFEIGDHENSSPEVLDEGSVLHFRRPLPVKIQALKDSQLLQISYSSLDTRKSRNQNENGEN
jgi:transcriptional regulator with XRE-family HTH domain